MNKRQWAKFAVELNKSEKKIQSLGNENKFRKNSEIVTFQNSVC